MKWFLLFCPYIIAVVLISMLWINQFEASPAAVSSSTAGLMYIFIPIWSAILSLPFTLIGFSLFAVVWSFETKDPFIGKIALVTVIISVLYFSFIISLQFDRYKPVRSVTKIKNLDTAGLSEYLRNDPYRDNIFALAAVAMNPHASADLLSEIAAREDAVLHDRSYGISNIENSFHTKWLIIGWLEVTGLNPIEKLTGKNFEWGFSVQELVSLNPNAGALALTRLSDSSNPYVRINVARHPSTPVSVIQSLYENANDPVLQPILLFRTRAISRPTRMDGGSALKMAIAHNNSTPDYILRDIAETTKGIFFESGLSKCRVCPEFHFY